MGKHIARLLVTILILGGLGYGAYVFFRPKTNNTVYGDMYTVANNSIKENSVNSKLNSLRVLPNEKVVAEKIVERTLSKEDKVLTREQLINATYPKAEFGERNNSTHGYRNFMINESSDFIKIKWQKYVTSENDYSQSKHAEIYNMRLQIYGMQTTEQFVKYFGDRVETIPNKYTFITNSSLTNLIFALDKVNVSLLPQLQFVNDVKESQLTAFNSAYKNFKNTESRIDEIVSNLQVRQENLLTNKTDAQFLQIKGEYLNLLNKVQEYIKYYSEFLQVARQIVVDNTNVENFYYNTAFAFNNAIVDSARVFSIKSIYTAEQFGSASNEILVNKNQFIYESLLISNTYNLKFASLNSGKIDISFVNAYNRVIKLNSSILLGNTANNVITWSNEAKNLLLLNDSVTNSRIPSNIQSDVKFVLHYFGFNEPFVPAPVEPEKPSEETNETPDEETNETPQTPEN